MDVILPFILQSLQGPLQIIVATSLLLFIFGPEALRRWTDIFASRRNTRRNADRIEHATQLVEYYARLKEHGTMLHGPRTALEGSISQITQDIAAHASDIEGLSSEEERKRTRTSVTLPMAFLISGTLLWVPFSREFSMVELLLTGRFNGSLLSQALIAVWIASGVLAGARSYSSYLHAAIFAAGIPGIVLAVMRIFNF
ncbi:MAG: hypothetical protein AAFR53_11045 [Pseudomonadota bacterium]